MPPNPRAARRRGVSEHDRLRFSWAGVGTPKRLASPNRDAIIAAFAFQLVLWLASGVPSEWGEFSPLGPLVGCFLALGSGLGLVGPLGETVKTRKN